MVNIIVLDKGFDSTVVESMEADALHIITVKGESVPISVLQACVGKEFHVDIIPGINKDVEIAFEIGKLYSKENGEVKVYSNNPKLDALCNAAKATAKAVKTRRPRKKIQAEIVPDNKEILFHPAPTDFMNPVESSALPETTAQASENSPAEKNGKHRSKISLTKLLDGTGLEKYEKVIADTIAVTESEIALEMTLRMHLTAAGCSANECKKAFDVVNPEFSVLKKSI